MKSLQVITLVTISLMVTCWTHGDFLEGKQLSIYYENDQFNYTDDHYTFGGRLALTNPDMQFPPWAKDNIPFFKLRGWDTSGAWFLGLQFYTPRNLRVVEQQLDDRPWAGWLHAGLRINRFGPKGDEDHRFMDTLEVTAGVVGPSAGSENVQTTIHDNFGGADPKGWHNQLKDEPALNLVWNRKRLIVREDVLGNFGADAFYKYGFSLGNVMIYQNLGFEARFGLHLPENFGIDRLGPAAFRRNENPPKFRVYGTIGAEGKVIEHNIFLDGNTFQDSHSVDKEELLGELFAGLGIHIKDDLTLSAVQVWRSEEFELQEHSNRFIAFNISYQF